jgi:hypothetical protein
MRNPSLRHVYATLAELNDTLTTGGAAALTNAGNNARKLVMLDEVSRLIDAKAHRGSGFGPWVGTKRYDGNRKDTLWLRADLVSLTSLSISPTQGGVAVTPTVETDFYLAGLGGYEAPYRKLILHGEGSPATFGTGYRTIEVVGTWSYPYRTRVLAATVSEVLDTSETGVDVSASTEFSPGMVMLVDSEQMYVTTVATNTLTVERGVNGTTAANHLTAAPVTIYVYDPSVHTLALRLAEKRWKARDAGADGTDGGGDVGVISPREGEDLIIRRMLGPVRLVGNV